MSRSLRANRLQSLPQQSPGGQPSPRAQAGWGSPPSSLSSSGRALTRDILYILSKGRHEAWRACLRQGGGNPRMAPGPGGSATPHRTGSLHSNDAGGRPPPGQKGLGKQLLG